MAVASGAFVVVVKRLSAGGCRFHRLEQAGVCTETGVSLTTLRSTLWKPVIRMFRPRGCLWWPCQRPRLKRCRVTRRTGYLACHAVV